MMKKMWMLLAALVLVTRAALAQPDPFLGEIRMVGFNFAPQGWALCDGQLLSIAQNTALFSLLGTTYGGDGQTTFALPDLRGRVPIHGGSGPGRPDRVLGDTGGVASTDTVNLIGKQRSYAPGEVDTLAGASGRAVGVGGQTDDNMPPFLTVYFIIALQGIFPSH